MDTRLPDGSIKRTDPRTGKSRIVSRADYDRTVMTRERDDQLAGQAGAPAMASGGVQSGGQVAPLPRPAVSPYQTGDRRMNVARAKADGQFDSIRARYNATNKETEMDSEGNIWPKMAVEAERPGAVKAGPTMPSGDGGPTPLGGSKMAGVPMGATAAGPNISTAPTGLPAGSVGRFNEQTKKWEVDPRFSAPAAQPTVAPLPAPVSAPAPAQVNQPSVSGLGASFERVLGPSSKQAPVTAQTQYIAPAPANPVVVQAQPPASAPAPVAVPPVQTAPSMPSPVKGANINGVAFSRPPVVPPASAPVAAPVAVQPASVVDTTPAPAPTPVNAPAAPAKTAVELARERNAEAAQASNQKFNEAIMRPFRSMRKLGKVGGIMKSAPRTLPAVNDAAPSPLRQVADVGLPPLNPIGKNRPRATLA